MATWARRAHRRVSLVNFCRRRSRAPLSSRSQKVKFGVDPGSLRHQDLPIPLLVLILKLHKEAPITKNIFRAPGLHGDMKKMIQILESGRVLNLNNYSVHTIASVLKKFLRKVPSGVFGEAGEVLLFATVDLPSEERAAEIRRLLTSLPLFTQRLLVLLFGTFQLVADNADEAKTGMTSEALGVSVAPSFFLTCVCNGKDAAANDVRRFTVATRIMRQMIDQFCTDDLFGRESYEYYVRVTGQTICVNNVWIYSENDRPAPALEQRAPVEEVVDLDDAQPGPSRRNNHQSKAAQTDGGPVASCSGALCAIPEDVMLDSCTRLSASLEESLFQFSVSSPHSSTSSLVDMEELRRMNTFAESTRSLSYLPQVHERQRARMYTRSEWFLQPAAVQEVLRPRAEWVRSGSRRRSWRAFACVCCGNVTA